MWRTLLAFLAGGVFFLVVGIVAFLWYLTDRFKNWWPG